MIISNITVTDYKEPTYKELLLKLMEVQSFLPVSGDASLLSLLTLEAVKKSASECASTTLHVPDLRKPEIALEFFEKTFEDSKSKLLELHQRLRMRTDEDIFENTLHTVLNDFADWSKGQE